MWGRKQRARTLLWLLAGPRGHREAGRAGDERVVSGRVNNTGWRVREVGEAVRRGEVRCRGVRLSLEVRCSKAGGCQGGGRRLRQHEGWRTGGHAAAESNAMHHALLCSFGLQMRWAVWMDDWGVGCEAEEDGREGGRDGCTQEARRVAGCLSERTSCCGVFWLLQVLAVVVD